MDRVTRSTKNRIQALLAWLRQQERDRKRAPPWSSKRQRDLIEDRTNDFRQGRERQRRLRLRAPAGENTADAPFGLRDARLPEKRLANPRLTRKDERPRAAPDAIKERTDRRQLLVSVDDRARHRVIIRQQKRGIENAVPDGADQRRRMCLSARRHRPKIANADDGAAGRDRSGRSGPRASEERWHTADQPQGFYHPESTYLKEPQQPSSRALTLITAVLRTFNAHHKRTGVYRFVPGIPVGSGNCAAELRDFCGARKNPQTRLADPHETPSTQTSGR